MATAILQPVKPCLRCGSVEKYRKGECKPCAQARSAIYRAANQEKIHLQNKIYQEANKDKVALSKKTYAENNREKVLQSARNYRANNPEKMAKFRADWLLRNPEKPKQMKAQWQKKNPEAIARYNHNRRSMKFGNGGSLSRGIVKRLYALQKGLCPCCRDSLGNDYHLDHIIPLAMGGANSDDNVQLLRSVCNLRKNTMHPIDYMQSKGFLI